mmetsp:Transcript_27389/g.51399  ORF Transcript_27389/g.51399 Transcript_27389/m.51399 type:complete len:204 (-) Transcript_27389:176-787(-)
MKAIQIMRQVQHFKQSAGQDDDFFQAGVAMTIGSSDLNCFRSLNPNSIFAGLVHNAGTALATSDSGADTCVLGTMAASGWKTFSIDEHRKANVLSWDSSQPATIGLQIGSGDTVVTAANGSKVIIRVHQAVLNPKSTTTLMSEHQIRANDIVWDPVHRNHRAGTDGSKGTQAFYLPKKGWLFFPEDPFQIGSWIDDFLPFLSK